MLKINPIEMHFQVDFIINFSDKEIAFNCNSPVAALIAIMNIDK